jgi:predicted nucleic acid-binding protein
LAKLSKVGSQNECRTRLINQVAFPSARQTRDGLAAMDALHVAAALSVGAEEFVTREKKTKPMFRVSSLKVVSIFD